MEVTIESHKTQSLLLDSGSQMRHPHYMCYKNKIHSIKLIFIELHQRCKGVKIKRCLRFSFVI